MACTATCIVMECVVNCYSVKSASAVFQAAYALAHCSSHRTLPPKKCVPPSWWKSRLSKCFTWYFEFAQRDQSCFGCSMLHLPFGTNPESSHGEKSMTIQSICCLLKSQMGIEHLKTRLSGCWAVLARQPRTLATVSFEGMTDTTWLSASLFFTCSNWHVAQIDPTPQMPSKTKLWEIIVQLEFTRPTQT